VDGFVEALQVVLGQGAAVIAPSQAPLPRANPEPAPSANSEPRSGVDAVPDFSHNPAELASGESAPGDATRRDKRDERDIARQLAAALDRAAELEQWDLAQRIASQAARIASQHPLLAERIARLRAARGEFEIALTIIDSCAQRTASMRLLRAVCLLQLGRRHEAHLDLHAWARRSSAPLQSRLALALLEWEEGDEEAAITALQRSLKQIEDPHTLAALLLMATMRERTALAAIWAGRLRASLASHPRRAMFDTLLMALGFVEREPQPLPDSPAAIATLATELIGNEDLLPALVEAQRIADDRDTATLLAASLEQAIDELNDQSAGCTALSELSSMLGRHDEAEAWGCRAATQSPD
jgi:hypothetical protein